MATGGIVLPVAFECLFELAIRANAWNPGDSCMNSHVCLILVSRLRVLDAAGRHSDLTHGIAARKYAPAAKAMRIPLRDSSGFSPDSPAVFTPGLSPCPGLQKVDQFGVNRLLHKSKH